MSIVFACPRCQCVMQAADDQGGSRAVCGKCSLPMEVPLPKGMLIEVRPAVAATPPTAAPPPPPLPPAAPIDVTPTYRKADELLEQAGFRKDAGDLDDAIALLREAFAAVGQAKAMFPVETFLRLPMYLHQAGKKKEAWEEFHHLLFKGYPNQSRNVGFLALDRAKIFDKMRLFLEHEGQAQLAAVFGVFSLVCKGINLYREERRRELKTWFNKSACSNFVSELKKYTGNLGQLQGVQYAILGELGEYPNIDFDLLARRIEVTLGK
ncbi:MAG: hypothetical protein K2R98_19655 [Gemmataceae bacterium]|nr:hypothetical protein [Gemmataceae bacterium]